MSLVLTRPPASPRQQFPSSHLVCGTPAEKCWNLTFLIIFFTFSICSGSGVTISPEFSFASKASMSRSFFLCIQCEGFEGFPPQDLLYLRFLSFLAGSVAVGWVGGCSRLAGVPMGSWGGGEEREVRLSRSVRGATAPPPLPFFFFLLLVRTGGGAGFVFRPRH